MKKKTTTLEYMKRPEIEINRKIELQSIIVGGLITLAIIAVVFYGLFNLISALR